MKNVGLKLRNIRRKLGLTQKKLSELANVSVKTIYNLETCKRQPYKRTIVKIANTLEKNFNLNFFEMIGGGFVWKLQDLSQRGLDIIEGGLLGDGNIGYYGFYSQAAKDKRYLEWLSELLNEQRIECNIIPIKGRNCYYLYTHSCPAFFELRKKWYHDHNGKIIKRVPEDLKLTPTHLLHWHLGDGNLKRDKRSENSGRPYVRLCTNGFLREDIELLVKKLNEMDLNFRPEPGLNSNKNMGYILRSKPDSLLNFFIQVNIKPPNEIKNCVVKIKKTGRKCTFKERWPNNDDWIRILAKNPEIGKIIRQSRLDMGITQKELSNKVGLKRWRTISDYENNRKHPSTTRFKKILRVLNLNIEQLLKIIIPNLIKLK